MTGEVARWRGVGGLVAVGLLLCACAPWVAAGDQPPSGKPGPDPQAQKKPADSEPDARLAAVKDMLKDFLHELLIQPNSGQVIGLTAQDAEAIQKECKSVLAAAPVVRARVAVTHGDRNWVPVYIYGTTPDYLRVRDWPKLAAGQPFTARDVTHRTAVCLLGQTVARELFGNESPVGKEVRLKDAVLKVVGVLERKGSNAMGIDRDDIVLLPWTTLQSRVLGQKDGENPGKRFAAVDQILVRKRVEKSFADANREVTALLRERHRIAAGQPDDFNIRDMSELIDRLKKATPKK
jgi:hypothetical protein